MNSVFIKQFGFPSYGSPVPFTHDAKYAKRMSEQQTVCVDINHLGERLIMNLSDYEPGCIPLRVDNYCDMAVFLRQV